ncbi:AzlD domain-containing protein [Priestia abyssalis]|uniref:AzlD domain-containing protein n=1 Tax=Priestia abyssalis TaxID=1221450 RepID=UPI0009957285|nr:AzlD domain-containing protein [Priestia abyssalis]
MNMFLLYLGMAVVTYFSRRAFLRLPDHLFSERLKNGLSFIPLGIFAALIFESLFLKDGSLVLEPLYLFASAVCLLMMKFSKNVFISFGLSLFVVVIVKSGMIG